MANELGVKFTLSPALDVNALNFILTQMKKNLGDAGKNIKLIDENEFNKGLESIRKKFDEIGDGVEGVSKKTLTASDSAGKMGKAFQFNMVVDAISKVSDVLGQINKVSVEYEASLAAVGAITGFTGKELEELGTKARSLAVQFGGSANDQLKSFQGILSKLGPEIAKDSAALELFGRNVNTLSKASGDDAATSMNAITDAMLQMGLATGTPMEQAMKSTEVINALAASAQVGAAEIPQVAQALVVAGVAAKGAHMDIVDVNAAIQVLAVGGKTGSEAGTALRNVLGLMQKATGPAADAMERIGTSSKELGEILTTQGLDVALAKINEGMTKLSTDAERNATLMTIFGTENAAAAGILLQNADKYKEFSDGIKEGMNGVGSAFEQAEMRMDTTQGMMDRAKAAIEDVFIGIGNVLSNNLKAALGVTTQFAPMIAALSGLKNVFPTESVVKFSTAIAGKLAPSILSKLVPSLLIEDAATKSLMISKEAMNATTAQSILKEAAHSVAMLAKAAVVKAVTVAQWLWNAAMSANPIGALIVGVVALVGVVGLLTAAFSKSAADREADLRRENAMIEERISNYKKQEQAINSQKSLIASYEELGAKTKKTAEEEQKYRDVQLELAKTFPGTISSTKSFSENLAALKIKAKEGGESVKKFHEEIKKLENRQLEVQIGIKGAQNDQIKEQMQDVFSFWNGYQLQARNAVSDFAKEMENAQDSDSLKDIALKFKEKIYQGKEFTYVRPDEKQQLEKLADNMVTNLEGGLKLKQENTKSKIKDLVDNIVSGGAKVNPQTLALLGEQGKMISDSLAKSITPTNETLEQIAKANNMPVEEVRKMYKDLYQEAQKSKVGEAIKESLEIKGKLNTAEQSQQLINDYSKMMSKIESLKSKQESGKGLTVNESRELDNLTAKAQETADKIGAIAPASKQNFKTVQDEAGNIKTVFDINISKANEFVEAQKKMGNTEAQNKFNQAIQEQSKEILLQKNHLDELKVKLEQTNDTTEKQKLIDKYNEENKAIQKNSAAFVEQFLKGKEAGLSIDDSIKSLAKSLKITDEKAREMVLSEALKKAANSGQLTKEKIKEIAGSYNYTAEAAEELLKHQKDNTKEAENTANAAKKIGNAYDEVAEKTDKEYKANYEKLRNLKYQKDQYNKGVKGVTWTSKDEADLAEVEQWFKYSKKKKIELDAFTKQFEDENAIKAAKSKEKKANDQSKTDDKLEDIKRKNDEANAQAALRAITDADERARQEKINGFRKTEAAIQSEINKIANNKKINENDKKVMAALNENLKITLQANAAELEKFDRDIAEKRAKEKLKSEQEHNKKMLDNIKAQFENIRNIENNYSNIDDYINNLEYQKEIKHNILNQEKEQKIQSLRETEEEYKKLLDTSYDYQAQIAAKEKALTGSISEEQKSILNNEIANLNELNSIAQKSIKDFEDEFDKSDTVKNITVNIDYESKKFDADIDFKIEEAKLLRIEDQAKREEEIAVFHAKEQYRQELLLAKGNQNLEFIAFQKFLQAKEEAHRKYLDNSLKLQDILLAQSMRFAEMFGQTLMDNSIKPVDNAIDELTEKLRKLTQKDTADNKNEYKKDVEEFKKAANEKVMSASDMFDRIDKLSEKSKKEEEEANKNSTLLRLSATKGFADVAKSFGDSATKHLQTAHDKLKKNLDDTIGKGKETTDILGTTFKDTSEDFQKFGEMALGSSVATFSALLASGMSFGEAFKKGILANLLETAEKAILIHIPEIYTVFVGWMGPWGVAAATAAIATAYGLLEVAKNAVNAYKGAVNIEGPGTETSDSIPANLSRGESVITASATRANSNIGLFEWLNKTGKPAYQYYVEERPDYFMKDLHHSIQQDRQLREETFNILYKNEFNIEYRGLDKLTQEIRDLRQDNRLLNQQMETLIEVNERGNFQRREAVKLDVKVQHDQEAMFKKIETNRYKSIINI